MIYFYLLLFSDLLNQKYIAALYFIWRLIYQLLQLSHIRLPIFGVVTRKGLTTPLTRRVVRCYYWCAWAIYVGVLGTGVPILACVRPRAWLHQRPSTAQLHQQTLKNLA